MTRAGRDLRTRVEAALAARPASVVLVDLAVGDPAVDVAVEELAEIGFYFGALLPEIGPWGDALRLQRATSPISPPNLATEGARDLLAYALRDRYRSCSG